MTRREIREHVFLILFRKDFYNEAELNEQKELYISNLPEPTMEESVLLAERFQSIIDNIEDIDKSISEASTGWKLSRMGKVELTILRLAVYEMQYDDDIPVKVAINEAVEIAKKYGGDNTPAFVNGILAKLV